MPHPVSRQITIAFALCLALSACVTVTLSSSASSGPTRPWPASATCPSPPGSASTAVQVVALMNAERTRARLPPLTLSPALSSAAHAFACEAAARGDIGHTGSDGSTLSERLRREGVSANVVAENNAAGQRSAAEVVAAWMASPHHRANVLRPEVSRVGLGQAQGAQLVWVADFAS